MDFITIINSKNNIPIRLTYKQWAHITETHNYMSGCLDMVIDTISDPDYIINGWVDELIALKHYPKTIISSKSVVVVYKESGEDGFVITAFMTSDPERIIRRGILWQKQVY